MKAEQMNRGSGAAIAYLHAIIAFLVLALGVKFLVQPPAINADRAEVRSKALAEIHATEDKTLNTLALTDRQRGIVQLPIETAMKIAAEKWSDPAAARADLVARQDKATAPVKPVSFE